MDSSYIETDEESEFNESDEELQEAFAKGLLKPGLNIVQEQKTKKVFVNNTGCLIKALNNLKSNKLEWIETLDLTNSQAPLGPEMALKLKETETRIEAQNKNKKKGEPVVSLADDPVLNDFKRDMIFQRQAQAAVLQGIPKLKNLGIRTKRPDDYFAEMAKSDDHMQKVRKHLQQKQLTTEKSEKAKQYRKMKKMGKQIQLEAKFRKMREKKEMLNEIKKFRKGKRKDLDFLENKPKKKSQDNFNNKSNNTKRDLKNKKYGFGGKKRGMKRNSSSSTNDFGSKRKFKKGRPKRLGKGRRQNLKAKNQRKK